jgi:PhnB protein
MATMNPFLNFNENCEEAFEFYKSKFGDEFEDFQRFNDAPSEEPLPPEAGERVMHVGLPIGEGSVLMGSDQPAHLEKVGFGNNISISLQTATDKETDKLYNGLSEGGQIIMPLERTFWGARFGMFVDKFGVSWMINQALNPEGSS